MKTRITSYSKEYIEKLTFRFIIKLNLDPRPLREKLKEIHLFRGTYSAILNDRPLSKRTLEVMRAYLENRRPKFIGLDENEGYCGVCEQVVLKNEMLSPWVCHECAREMKNRSNSMYRINNREAYNQRKNERYKERMKDPIFREKELEKKRLRYIKSKKQKQGGIKHETSQKESSS